MSLNKCITIELVYHNYYCEKDYYLKGKMKARLSYRASKLVRNAGMEVLLQTGRAPRRQDSARRQCGARRGR